VTKKIHSEMLVYNSLYSTSFQDRAAVMVTGTVQAIKHTKV